MEDCSEILQALVAMSQRLGEPSADNVILGEGNTSAKVDEDTFLVKASGTQLPTIEADGFCRVRFEPILALLDGPDLDDDQVKAALHGARVDDSGLRPSVETVLHACLLAYDKVRFVGHTHPGPILAVLSSTDPEALARGRLFPDEIVVCGPAWAYVPYVDPGLPLAREVRRQADEFIAAWGVAPKVMLMQNHGLIALGATDREVVNVTMMASKAARVLLGTYALGGPNFLSEQQASRIYTRPDEKYRQDMLERGN